MRRSLALGGALPLAACSMAPSYQRPAAPVPAAWPTGPAYAAKDRSDLPSVTYAQIFRDPRLQALITQALANNRDLRIAVANIAAARAKYHIQRAEQLPEIDANASYRHSYSGGGAGSPVSAGGAAPAAGGNNIAVDAGLNAFEIDLFGHVRSLTDAARARYLAREAATDATRLTLVGDIATAWLTYASDRSLLAIDRDTIANAQASAALTRDRYAAGIAAHSDVDQAEQTAHLAAADAAQQETQLAQDVNALTLLVGAQVDPRLLPASIEEAAPTIGDVPAGLSSAILLRRPDVVEAEDELKATNAEIGVARAQLFPAISLTGLAGLASNALISLFAGRSFNWSAGANAGYSIFRGGAGRTNVRFSEAQRDATLATYEKAIQTAFQEVSDALARHGTIDRQIGEVRASLASARDYYAMSELRYRGGIETFLQTLDAQRTLYTARRTLALLDLTRAANRVTLYRTLGGDRSLVDAGSPGPVKPE